MSTTQEDYYVNPKGPPGCTGLLWNTVFSINITLIMPGINYYYNNTFIYIIIVIGLLFTLLILGISSWGPFKPRLLITNLLRTLLLLLVISLILLSAPMIIGTSSILLILPLFYLSLSLSFSFIHHFFFFSFVI